MLAFTYLQVMPEFLEFLFLFGFQEQAEDLYFSGFRQRSLLSSFDGATKVPQRSWSGSEIQMCYSLKSVERSKTQIDWPWSIRHCAIYHGFDTDCVRSVWIFIKGDQLMESRIKAATKAGDLLDLSTSGRIDRAFAAALATHIVMCDWSVEKWRWYIKFLEEQFEILTAGAVTINVDVPVSPMRNTDISKDFPRTNTGLSQQTARSRVFSFTRTSRVPTQISEGIPMSPMQPNQPTRTFVNASGKKQPMPPGQNVDASQTPKVYASQFDNFGQQQFSFRELQKIQEIEEAANETVLVLKLNMGEYD